MPILENGSNTMITMAKFNRRLLASKSGVKSVGPKAHKKKVSSKKTTKKAVVKSEKKNAKNMAKKSAKKTAKKNGQSVALKKLIVQHEGYSDMIKALKKIHAKKVKAHRLIVHKKKLIKK